MNSLRNVGNGCSGPLDKGLLGNGALLSLVVRIRIGMVVCGFLKRELGKLVENDPYMVHKEYLAFDLLIRPEKMRHPVMGRMNAVLLGHTTFHSIEGVAREVKMPMVLLDGDDLIASSLTPAGHAEEKRIGAGTWFRSPGWVGLGRKGAIRELHLAHQSRACPSVHSDEAPQTTKMLAPRALTRKAEGGPVSNGVTA
jgi:hypothetical protein